MIWGEEKNKIIQKPHTTTLSIRTHHIPYSILHENISSTFNSLLHLTPELQIKNKF